MGCTLPRTPMGKFGKGMAPFAAQTTEERRAYIDARAKQLGWTRAEVLTQIISFWFALGAPVLNEIDRVISIPEECQEPIHPFWLGLVAMEAQSDRRDIVRVASRDAAKATARLRK